MKSFLFAQGTARNLVYLGTAALMVCGVACGDDTGSGGSGANGGASSGGGGAGAGPIGGGGSTTDGGGGAGGTPTTGGGGSGGDGGGGGGLNLECGFYPDCNPELEDECLCVGCESGACDKVADCICPACQGNALCTADSCTDDGVCDPYLEACICADCAEHPLCR